MSTTRHPLWDNFVKLIRQYDKAEFYAAYIDSYYALTIQAGPPWSNYEPENIVYDDISDYKRFQSVLYYGDLSDVSEGHASLVKLIAEGKVKVMRDYDFANNGIRYGSMYWTKGASNNIGALVSKASIELISEYLCEKRNYKFPEKNNHSMNDSFNQKHVVCRVCTDPDPWNEPDLIGDNKYTCYRCRNNISVMHRNVPVELHEKFDCYYRNVDMYTKK